ncbi:MAG TPA: NUDIX domain-containing protein [Herpetosiphonaceae bacterium]|nr:NUDIX domain-containing protein [Herpetosiphonaceae bacterium]
MTDVVDKVAWIHIVDRRVLSTRSRGKDTYYFPGGKREPGETDLECLAREVKEELDVDLLAETLRYLGQFEAQAHGKSAGVLVRMPCYSGQYAGVLSAASEIEEMAWLTYADRHKTSPVDQLIFAWLKERDLID